MPPQDHATPPAPRPARLLSFLAGMMAIASLFLVFHTYGFNLLPYAYRIIPASALKP